MLHVHILLLNMLSDDLTLMLLILSNVKAAILTCRVTSLSVSKSKANTPKANTEYDLDSTVNIPSSIDLKNYINLFLKTQTKIKKIWIINIYHTVYIYILIQLYSMPYYSIPILSLIYSVFEKI